MEDTMDTMPREIVLTGEPFFVAVEEEQQPDGCKVILLRGDVPMQLRAVPAAGQLMGMDGHTQP